MPELEIDYERYLIYYKELLFGKKFESKKRNRVRVNYYKLIIQNLFYFIYSLLVTLPYLLKIIINITREMDFLLFSDYVSLNFFIIDKIRHKKLSIKGK